MTSVLEFAFLWWSSHSRILERQGRAMYKLDTAPLHPREGISSSGHSSSSFSSVYVCAASWLMKVSRENGINSQTKRIYAVKMSTSFSSNWNLSYHIFVETIHSLTMCNPYYNQCLPCINKMRKWGEKVKAVIKWLTQMRFYIKRTKQNPQHVHN